MRNGPERIGDILSSVFVRRGLGQQQSLAAHQRAWEEAAGPIVSRYTSLSLIHI